MDYEFHPHLRRLDPHRDLQAAADLIDLCFGSQIDFDGREYLRIVREAAHNPMLVHWVRGCNETVSSPMFGYIWEEEGRLVGNTSLIPFFTPRGWIYLIANVAVHPDYRHRGIARQLTQAALRHIREQSVDAAWLQVRTDAPEAYHLYQNLGFQERARRITWNSIILPVDAHTAPTGTIQITSRRRTDWALQETWLQQTYPSEITWNQPLPVERIRPKFSNWLINLFEAQPMIHWAARSSQELLGVLTWEAGRLTNQLYLAPGKKDRAQTIATLLQTARRSLDPLRPLVLNFPAGDCEEVFYNCGFIPDCTLIWMEINFSGRLDPQRMQ